jgi:hypothetical protein
MKAVHFKPWFLPCSLLVLLSLATLTSSAEDFSQLHNPRIFTLTDDKTLTLKVLDWNEQRKRFYVENETGQKSWVSPDSFTDADRSYLKEWIVAKWFLSDDKVYVSARRTTRGDHVSYDVSIQNKTSVDYEKVTMKYEVERVLDHYETGELENINVPGKIFIGRIESGSQRNFKTQPVKADEVYKLVHTPEPVRVTSGVGYTYTNEVPRKTGKQKVNGVRLQFLGPKLDHVQIVKEVHFEK